MSKLDKIAAKDAYDYGVALMFFGEGAGTRRKLITAVVDQKVEDIPGYAEAFDKAFAKLDQLKIAEIALKERKKLDRAAKAGKNLRALKRGNIAGLTNGVYLIAGTYMVLRMTGYDKVVEAEARKAWAKGQREWHKRRAAYRAKQFNKPFVVTDLRGDG